MTWEDVTVYGMIDGEEDELGNPEKIPDELWHGRGRYTPWTDSNVQAAGRDVTSNEMQYALPVDYETVKDAIKLECNFKTFDVTAVIKLTPRWTVIQVRRFET